MRNQLQNALCLIIVFCCFYFGYVEAAAQSEDTVRNPARPVIESLNQIKIGRCGGNLESRKNGGDEGEGESTVFDDLLSREKRRGLVIDARPFTVAQIAGKSSFEGGAGRVTVIHMNPFVYNYKISVAQKELVSTASAEFLKLLLPQSLAAIVGPQSGGDNKSASRIATADKLSLIENRLGAHPDPRDQPSENTATAMRAVASMYAVFDKVKKDLEEAKSGPFKAVSSPIIDGPNSESANLAFANYTKAINDLRDEEAESQTTCVRATRLHKKLSQYSFTDYFDKLDSAEAAIKKITPATKDLENLTIEYAQDVALNSETIRCGGFNCVGQFKHYAQAVLELLASYQGEIATLRQNGEEMNNMYLLTVQMKSTEGLFARTFPVEKRYELSEAQVTIKREKILEKRKNAVANANSAANQSGGARISSNNTGPSPALLGGASNEGVGPTTLGPNNFATDDNRGETQAHSAASPAKKTEVKEANGIGTAGQVNETLEIGRPRFTLSAGLTYSPLSRRAYQSVKGFAHDAQGNLNGDGSANVVGFSENSPRSLRPMVMLNSHLWSYKPVNLYFSMGVTAKRDDDVDLEYFFGPSIGFLNNRALFTIGAYAGKPQNLVNDVKIGDELPDSIGDAKLFRKSYTWKLGLSLSYNFSLTKKELPTGASRSGSSSSADELRDEIRIGKIPFNLALGLAYSSLEDRAYDEIVGFARDRQGNLTNGRALTRIVGLTSSSDYRLTPLALLHSRLTNFGRFDIYVSTGVTGKKNKDDFDIEYLLGTSFNLYRRKVFVTVGAFIGKQQMLGGDFFEGARLGETQNVTTQNRYVWKPAISISYDVSKIVPRSRD